MRQQGALKLKEISYIHAEGYPAAEMKHGPIALIDQFMPVVIIAPTSDPNYRKLVSNIEEASAHGGGGAVTASLMDIVIGSRSPNRCARGAAPSSPSPRRTTTS